MDDIVITWGVAVLLVIPALVLAWPLLRRWKCRRKMERTIASSGVDQMCHVLLEDGMGGQTYFERLLLTPSEIRVLETNSRDGIIFAGERMDSWAQVVGKRTIRFSNPLYQLEESVGTLRYHLPKLNVRGNVLFIGECSFPKGRPDHILTPSELEAARDESVSQAVQPVIKQAWEKLQGLVRKVNPATEGYLLPVKEAPAYGRWLAIALVLGLATAWLLWRYLGV